MSVPMRRKLGDAIKALLESEIGMPVGIVRPPTDNQGVPLDLPYIILDPIPGGGYSGPPYCAPNADADFHYQITYASEREDQAEWMGDEGAKVLLARDGSGHFIHDISYDDHVVMDRDGVGSPGKIDRVGTVFSRADTYKFEVTSHS